MFTARVLEHGFLDGFHIHESDPFDDAFEMRQEKKNHMGLDLCCREAGQALRHFFSQKQ